MKYAWRHELEAVPTSDDLKAIWMQWSQNIQPWALVLDRADKFVHGDENY